MTTAHASPEERRGRLSPGFSDWRQSRAPAWKDFREFVAEAGDRAMTGAGCGGPTARYILLLHTRELWDEA